MSPNLHCFLLGLLSANNNYYTDGPAKVTTTCGNQATEDEMMADNEGTDGHMCRKYT